MAGSCEQLQLQQQQQQQQHIPAVHDVFKQAQLRYRRRPEDPDRLDDLSECVDFSRSRSSNDDDDETPQARIRPVIIDRPVSFSSAHTVEEKNDFSCDEGASSLGVEKYAGPYFTLSGYDGFLYAPQALSPELQLQLAFQAVSVYCEFPHKTNIELIDPKHSEVLNIEKQARCGVIKRSDKKAEKDTATTIAKNPSIAKDPCYITMWELWKNEHHHNNQEVESLCTDSQQLPGSQSQSQSLLHRNSDHRFYRSFAKLSWATLGFSFDWTARVYLKEERCWSPIPSDLVRLAKFFATAEARFRRQQQQQQQTMLQQHPHSLPAQSSPDTIMTTELNHHHHLPQLESRLKQLFQPSAAIVNYYHSKSIMGGHRDDSELALDQPIVSFSLGRAAIFLLGGPTRQDPVIPILVRPGDVMIMGGASRLNYHGMARLLPPRLENKTSSIVYNKNDSQERTTRDTVSVPSNTVISEPMFPRSTPMLQSSVPDTELLALADFLQWHRININLRQVYVNDN